MHNVINWELLFLSFSKHSRNSLDVNAIDATLAQSYDEQSMTVDMYNDEFDHFNKVPHLGGQNGDVYLKAALSQHDLRKQKRNTNNLNSSSKKSLKKNGHARNSDIPPLYDNLAYQPELTLNNSTLESLQTTDI